MNAVAGGGSFIAFPALVFTGVPQIPANATNTVALWTGIVFSGGAFRERLDVPRRVLWPLLITSFVGGVAGAFLLLKTPEHTFAKVLPWLMAGATMLFIFGRKLSRGPSSVSHDATTAAIVGASVFELAVAVYGGYFGGGVGIVNLAMLAAIGMTDMHAMNALKSVLGSAINGVAVIVFIAKSAVYWPQAVVMIAGAALGGYFGAKYSLKLNPVLIRWFVIMVGTGMSVYFFVRAY